MESQFNMELPYEVLVYLFKYLPKGDRKSASQTCNSWYQAANDYFFLKNKVAIFYKSLLNEDESSPLEIFIDSPTNYSNFLFQEVEFTAKCNKFWDVIGHNILSLTLNNCDVGEKTFINMLNKTPNLETLNILNCRELFMSGRLLEGKAEGLLDNCLDKLKVLSLSGNQYLTDALFNRFVKAAPSLEEINLSVCSLQFHLGLVKKFYSNEVDILSKPSESVLTFYFVMKYITSRAKTMKRLVFSQTLIDGTALKTLGEVKDLKLESLVVFCCDQLTNDGIISLTNHQTFLKELNIGMCSRVTDQSLMHICKNLVNLENLSIQRCRAVTDLGLVELKNLKKLKTLNISQCEQITNHGLENGICSQVNCVLQELDIHSLNIDQCGMTLISECLPNLRYLDISYCFNAVTDKIIQLIFMNQVYLETLKISHCDKVTDAGLIGMGPFVDFAKNDNTICYEAEPPLKINLGSRAEEEIIRDAYKKKEVMKMCEKISAESFSGYSLDKLKSLKELDISGCNRITDVSLTYSFNLIELVILNMSRCQQVTQEGIGHLVRSCPSIEYINLVDCYNLKDDAVLEIVRFLRRLRHLELRGCNQLTDESLNAVKNHCEKLQFLDIQGCRNISPELVCSVGSLRTLHTILISKPGPYIQDGVKNRTPAPAFLPTLMRKLLSRRNPEN